MLVLLLPISVSAGLLGALGSVFSRESSTEMLSKKNVQTMNLIASASSPQLEQNTYEPSFDKNALVAIAAPAEFDATSAVAKNQNSDHISVYVVREGDTLSQIAEMFGVTVNTIKWSNDLESNVLKEGQNLVILPVSGVKHVVVKGDTVDTIAKKYKGNAEEILAYNNLEDNKSLEVGSTIIIPDGEMVSSPKNSSASSYAGKLASGLKEYIGYFLRPIVGGKRTQGIHGYNAIDIAAPIGTPIYAAADGEVIISRSGGWNGGYGTYIVIKHDNGTQTLYSHNQSNAVSVGNVVKKGDIIGYVGNTGKVTGPHLHFEVRGGKNPF